jgi:hypothetical protein
VPLSWWAARVSIPAPWDWGPRGRNRSLKFVSPGQGHRAIRRRAPPVAAIHRLGYKLGHPFESVSAPLKVPKPFFAQGPDRITAHCLKPEAAAGDLNLGLPLNTGTRVLRARAVSRWCRSISPDRRPKRSTRLPCADRHCRASCAPHGRGQQRTDHRGQDPDSLRLHQRLGRSPCPPSAIGVRVDHTDRCTNQ